MKDLNQLLQDFVHQRYFDFHILCHRAHKNYALNVSFTANPPRWQKRNELIFLPLSFWQFLAKVNIWSISSVTTARLQVHLEKFAKFDKMWVDFLTVLFFEVYLENSDWLFPPLLGANSHHRRAPASQGCTTAHEMVRNDAICLSTSHGSLKDKKHSLHIKQEVNDKATKKLVFSITMECQETMKHWLTVNWPYKLMSSWVQLWMTSIVSCKKNGTYPDRLTSPRGDGKVSQPWWQSA